jgi:hypothetical protein
MKFESYPPPMFCYQSEMNKDLIPIYRGCDSGEFKCACLGMCLNVIDHLTKDEIRSMDVTIVKNKN